MKATKIELETLIRNILFQVEDLDEDCVHYMCEDLGVDCPVCSGEEFLDGMDIIKELIKHSVSIGINLGKKNITLTNSDGIAQDIIKNFTD
jgi:hypothetical protein